VVTLVAVAERKETLIKHNLQHLCFRPIFFQ
jgi:hypothetical protein